MSLQITPSYMVQIIKVITKNGRIFEIHLKTQNANYFDSDVLAFDKVSNPNLINSAYSQNAKSHDAYGNFESAMEFIISYLLKVDMSDLINDVHNACNCPFISDKDQEIILRNKNINVAVRVN